MKYRTVISLVTVGLLSVLLTACWDPGPGPVASSSSSNSTSPALVSPPITTADTAIIPSCDMELSKYLGYSICDRAPICVSNTNTSCLKWGDFESLLVAMEPYTKVGNSNLPVVIDSSGPKHFRLVVGDSSSMNTIGNATYLGTPSGGIRPRAINENDTSCVRDEQGDVGCEQTITVYPPSEEGTGTTGGVDFNSATQPGSGGEVTPGGNTNDKPDPSPKPTPAPTVHTQSPTPSPSPTQNSCHMTPDQGYAHCQYNKNLICKGGAALIAQKYKVVGAAIGLAFNTLCEDAYVSICQDWKSDPCGDNSFTLWFGYSPGPDGRFTIGFGTKPF